MNNTGYFLALVCIWLLNTSVTGQVENLYRVYLRDKAGSLSIEQVKDYLSERAIERRTRFHIPFNDEDVPISKMYLDSIRQLGLKIVCTSRWMNTVVVSGMDSIRYEQLKRFRFVDKIKQVADTLHRPTWYRVRKFFYESSHGLQPTLSVWPQIGLNGGYYLHDRGYYGRGVWIAVIDAGFLQATECMSLQPLFADGRVISTRDFVYPASGVYTASYHGTAVLSIMAASGTDSLTGVAPLASYVLLRSEDVAGEYPAEEDFWVAAAEYADSIGTDIINTSLGYTEFDNPAYNYSYADMNGITSHIAKAAAIAASKGMLVVVSAGNDGNHAWHYIGTPADARGILTAGAVDLNGVRAEFSSVGPTADGRIKPEVMAMGKRVRAEYSPNNFWAVNGTSFSAPIISGLSACLWEAFPRVPSRIIRQAIIISSSLYASPDSLMGYGIPDFNKAYAWLLQNKKPNTSIALYPNPCYDRLTLEWYNPDREEVGITCTTLTGQVVFRTRMHENQKITFTHEIQSLNPGIYFIHLAGRYGADYIKFIKQ